MASKKRGSAKKSWTKKSPTTRSPIKKSPTKKLPSSKSASQKTTRRRSSIKKISSKEDTIMEDNIEGGEFADDDQIEAETDDMLPPENDTTPRLKFPTKIRKRPRPEIENLMWEVDKLMAPLMPFVSEADHSVHPAFPLSNFQYHLLNEAQLDNLARHYHQWVTSPNIFTDAYPCNAHWNHEFLEHLGAKKGSEHRCHVKRRKFGRFIGIVGCDTPVEEFDEYQRWLAQRASTKLKTASDFSFHGRRGFGNW